MTDATRRTSSQLERDAEARRYAVEETLEALKLKLSSAQLVDSAARSLTSASGQGGELVANLARQVKENPLPAILTGVGLAWLILSDEKVQTRQLAAPDRNAGRRAYDKARYVADEAKHGAKHALAELKRGAYAVEAEAEDAVYEVYDMALLAADEAKLTVEEINEQLKAGAYAAGEAVNEVGDKVRDLAADAFDEARHATRRAERSLRDFVSDEPFAAAAIALGVGAAIGAALPATRHEDEMLGKARDRVRRDAMQTAASVAEESRAERSGS